MASSAPAAGTADAATPGKHGRRPPGNLALVLGPHCAVTRRATHLTRAQVAAATGLTKASVSSLVLDLLDAGIVREIGLNPQGERGRPGVGLELNPARGVHGHGNQCRLHLRGSDGPGRQPCCCRKSGSRTTATAPARPWWPRSAALAADAAEGGRSLRGSEVLGGGLAVPGLVDASNPAPSSRLPTWLAGTPRLGPGSAASRRAAGHHALQRSQRCGPGGTALPAPHGGADFLFVSGEVGVGGGLVISSELFTGPEGHAGELGHVVVQPEGVLCSCGGTGCLETVAGQDAIFSAAGIRREGAVEVREHGRPAGRARR